MKHWAIIVILALALFLRVYRAGELTGFYFDQGRDAKIIWNLWHNHKFFLIGPVTGIEGIFLGPFYYYLIAPAYLLGQGNPVFASFELALLNVVGIYVIYLIGKEYFNYKTGLLAALLISLSFNLTLDHRWLSNPTPLPLFSALTFFALLKNKWWLLGLGLGLCLQLEAASAIFFIPAIVFTLVWQKKRPSFVGFGLFLVTLVPQIYFNFRHGNILFKAFEKFLIAEKSFRPEFGNFYIERLKFYYDSFSVKISPDANLSIVLAIFILVLAAIYIRKLPHRPIAIMLVWILTPLILLMFYHGNNGYVWAYYFTGIYSVFILLVAALLAKTSRIFLSLFLIFFIISNIYQLKAYLTTSLERLPDITLGSSLAAVDWVYKNSVSSPFNIDVYVPPVIAHSYDYLFLWRGSTKYHVQPVTDLQPLLYTLYEVDLPHPERLDAWLIRQASYAFVEDQVHFGGVTVERRNRI